MWRQICMCYLLNMWNGTVHYGHDTWLMLHTLEVEEGVWSPDPQFDLYAPSLKTKALPIYISMNSQECLRLFDPCIVFKAFTWNKKYSTYLSGAPKWLRMRSGSGTLAKELMGVCWWVLFLDAPLFVVFYCDRFMYWVCEWDYLATLIRRFAILDPKTVMTAEECQTAFCQGNQGGVKPMSQWGGHHWPSCLCCEHGQAFAGRFAW